MTTILVVIPETEQKTFLSKYEFFSEGVLPQSAEVINDDGQFVLYKVVCFKNTEKKQFVEDFKKKTKLVVLDSL